MIIKSTIMGVLFFIVIALSGCGGAKDRDYGLVTGGIAGSYMQDSLEQKSGYKSPGKAAHRPYAGK